LSEKIDGGSVRVAGITGKATIIEVSTSTKVVNKKEVGVTERVKELEIRREGYQQELEVVNKTLTRIRARTLHYTTTSVFLAPDC
jgi:hypothetical protein